MRRRLASTGARGFVVGLSGGLDSAVVARLAQLAAPGNVVATVLPCHSDPEDERDAEIIAKHFALTTVRVDLSQIYDTTLAAAQAALQTLPEQTRPPKPADPIRVRLPFANVKPRLRMTTLYFLAFRGMSAEQQNLDRYRVGIDSYRTMIVILAGLLLGVMAGASAASNVNWRRLRQRARSKQLSATRQTPTSSGSCARATTNARSRRSLTTTETTAGRCVFLWVLRVLHAFSHTSASL